MLQEKKVKDVSCIVCGRESDGARLCERCRESLRLCEAENYVMRKMMLKNANTEDQTLSNTGDL